ncbi:SH3 domain-containing protein [Helicobacter cynogastricus]|uniref:SH3 domain-containing protein n=1 Tax=Helicobacter cynogastricus TaxID=329937 RepID=UPI000CF10063|nr:SH3 domain-containing protein [Helicobacter cynogastricus]
MNNLKVLRLYGLAGLWVAGLLGVYVGIFFQTRLATNPPITPIEIKPSTPPAQAKTQTPPPPPKPLEQKPPAVESAPPKVPPQTPPPPTPSTPPTPTTPAPQPVVTPQIKPIKPEIPKFKTYIVVVNVLNVRALPNIHARVTQQLMHAQKVQVLEIKDGWGRTKRGWVFLDFLERVP